MRSANRGPASRDRPRAAPTMAARSSESTFTLDQRREGIAAEGGTRLAIAGWNLSAFCPRLWSELAARTKRHSRALLVLAAASLRAESAMRLRTRST